MGGVPDEEVGVGGFWIAEALRDAEGAERASSVWSVPVSGLSDSIVRRKDEERWGEPGVSQLNPIGRSG